MKVIDNPKISSIVPFLKYKSNQLEKSLIDNRSLYIIDNMSLSKIRKDIVNNPIMIKGFNQSDLIIIPDVILEEASKNLDEQVFKKYYYELFHLLTQENEIFVVSLETLFELLQNMVGKKDALNTLKSISVETVRLNQAISDSIRNIDINSKNALEDLRQSIVSNGKNAGERFINIFALVFVSLYFGPTYIFSEDVKGIYGPFKTFISNDRLMELINVQESIDLFGQYQFLSYESLIQAVFMEGNLGKGELLDLIVNSNRNESRNILYSLDGYACHTPISNDQLLEWIIKEKIKVQF
jgi:hypothetical protein